MNNMNVIYSETLALRIYTIFLINTVHKAVTGQTYGDCFHKPSFVSAYTVLKANSGPESELMTEHGFSEFPIKVDLQVISTKNTPGSQVVFPGLGSSQRDDDENSTYGGVVYRYDKTSVYMYVPNRNDGFKTGTVIYTGNGTWIGSNHYNEKDVNVRAKAWKTSDFPKPDFESNWTIIRSQNQSDSFKEVPHGLGVEPEYVIVQVRHGETDMISEGIGSSMHTKGILSSTEMGGLIYSYDTDNVRIWVPGYNEVGYVFSAADGWGNRANITVDYGYFKIRAWKVFNGNLTTNTQFDIGASTTDKKDVSFNRTVNIRDSLISVTMKSSFSKFVFPAMGAVQNSNSMERYGGVVYSYSERVLHLWHPPVSGKFVFSYITCVDTYWGSSFITEQSKTALLQVRVWEPYTICPPPTTSPSAVTHPLVTVTQTTATKLTSAKVTTTKITTPLFISTTLTSPKRFFTTVPMTAQPSPKTSMSTTAVISSSKTKVLPKLSTSLSTSFVLPTSPSLSTTTGRKTTPTTPNGFSTSQESSGGISSAAVGAIAAVASLAGLACLSGVLFALVRRSREKKKKTKVEPEESKDDGKMDSDLDEKNEEDDHDYKPDVESSEAKTIDENSHLPESDIPVENGQPPSDAVHP